MKLLNDHWEIRIKIRWELKDGLKATIPCPDCKAKAPNLLTDDDYYVKDNRFCETCWGKGCLNNPELKPKPAFSNDLRDHLSEAFNDFMDAFEEEEVK